MPDDVGRVHIKLSKLPCYIFSFELALTYGQLAGFNAPLIAQATRVGEKVNEKRTHANRRTPLSYDICANIRASPSLIHFPKLHQICMFRSWWRMRIYSFLHCTETSIPMRHIHISA